MTEQNLKKAVRGDPSAFEELVSPYLKGLYNFILYRIKDGQDDVYQETILEVWKRLGSFDGRSSLKTWMYGIARHKCLDQYRRMYRQAETTQALDETLADDGFEASLAAKADMEAAMQELDKEDQELLYLIYAQGFTCREASEILGIPEGTVKSRLHTLRKALRDKLGGNIG